MRCTSVGVGGERGQVVGICSAGHKYPGKEGELKTSKERHAGLTTILLPHYYLHPALHCVHITVHTVTRLTTTCIVGWPTWPHTLGTKMILPDSLVGRAKGYTLWEVRRLVT